MASRSNPGASYSQSSPPSPSFSSIHGQRKLPSLQFTEQASISQSLPFFDRDCQDKDTPSPKRSASTRAGTISSPTPEPRNGNGISSPTTPKVPYSSSMRAGIDAAIQKGKEWNQKHHVEPKKKLLRSINWDRRMTMEEVDTMVDDLIRDSQVQISPSSPLGTLAMQQSGTTTPPKEEATKTLTSSLSSPRFLPSLPRQQQLLLQQEEPSSSSQRVRGTIPQPRCSPLCVQFSSSSFAEVERSAYRGKGNGLEITVPSSPLRNGELPLTSPSSPLQQHLPTPIGSKVKTRTPLRTPGGERSLISPYASKEHQVFHSDLLLMEDFQKEMQ